MEDIINLLERIAAAVDDIAARLREQPEPPVIQETPEPPKAPVPAPVKYKKKFGNKRWTPEDDAKLRKLAGTGLSLDEIGEIIGERTGKAVRGRMHALGIVVLFK